MAGPKQRVTNAETEAAAWHSRLGERSVSTQTIKDFFSWRELPENADAYRRCEQAWGESRKLATQPAMQDALNDVLSRGSRPPATRRRRLVAGGLIGITAAAALAFCGWSWRHTRTMFSTSVGEQRLVQLSDGSSVRLDTASRIRVRFDGDQRLIDLESGQALFDVSHDGERPFIVQAGSARVTAVGTVFDVRRDGEDARVTLVSGIVEVAGGRTTQRIEPGQQARVTPTRSQARHVDTQAEISWTDGRIVFRDTPLSVAVAEVNRYLTAKVELDAAARQDERVNGVFKTGDRDAFVSTASEVFGLRASAGPDGSIRLSERGK